jgi:hypothetical protein
VPQQIGGVVLTNHDYIHGKLRADIEYIKKKVDSICDQPQLCSRQFLKKKYAIYVIIGIVSYLVGKEIIPFETIAAFIP